jgi:hypothetical protein
MKKNLMSLGVLALFMTAAGTMNAAVATCDSLLGAGATNVTVLNNGGMGCMEDGLLFNNFSVAVATGSTAPAEIDVTMQLAGGTTNPNSGISIEGNEVFFQLNPNMGGASINGNDTDLHLTFTVSGGVGGADLSVGGINASINETDCSVNPNGSPCTTPNTVWNTTDNSGGASSCAGNVANPNNASNLPCAFGNAGVPEIWVFKDISITSTAAHLTNFEESFMTAPEPMTTSLVGFGLLGIGFLGRRLRKS